MFTIGPACQEVETLARILTAGATVARVDLSWGAISYHERSLQNLVLAMKKTRRMCAVMLDTMGREIAVKGAVDEAEDGWMKHGHVYDVNIGDSVIPHLIYSVFTHLSLVDTYKSRCSSLSKHVPFELWKIN